MITAHKPLLWHGVDEGTGLQPDTVIRGPRHHSPLQGQTNSSLVDAEVTSNLLNYPGREVEKIKSFTEISKKESSLQFRSYHLQQEHEWFQPCPLVRAICLPASIPRLHLE